MGGAHASDGRRDYRCGLDRSGVADLSGATAAICAAQATWTTAQRGANSEVSECADMIPLVCGATRPVHDMSEYHHFERFCNHCIRTKGERGRKVADGTIADKIGLNRKTLPLVA